jgi:hypothetical protein
MLARDESPLPAEEQDLLADTWIQALDLQSEGESAAGQELLRRGLARAGQMEAPWQPVLLRQWQIACERYQSAAAGAPAAT